jgi:exodeoxyribonuclease VII small subunit
MESAELPLDDIIQSYEEGMVYLKFCREKLKAAELKIEKLQPGDDTGPEAATSSDEKKDDIDLF